MKMKKNNNNKIIQTNPKTSPDHSPHVPRSIKKSPRHDQKSTPKVTRARRESNPVPPDSPSAAPTTSLSELNKGAL